jgi:hypothetical protein
MPQFHQTSLIDYQTEVLVFQVANSDHASHAQPAVLRMERQKTYVRGCKWVDEELR